MESLNHVEKHTKSRFETVASDVKKWAEGTQWIFRNCVDHLQIKMINHSYNKKIPHVSRFKT